jgi:hypothetical protein
MFKLIIAVIIILLLGYNDWELLGVLQGYIMGFVQ